METRPVFRGMKVASNISASYTSNNAIASPATPQTWHPPAQTIGVTQITIRCADEFPLAATLFVPKQDIGSRAIVISPGMGVPQTFYARFAKYLASRGHTVVTYDYRGVGASVDSGFRGSDMRMEDWGRLDLDAVLAWTRDEIGPKRLFLIGHSAGGQLVGLARHSEALSGMIFVACQSGYWKHFTKIKRRLWLFWHLVIPALSKGWDYFPARLFGLSTVNLPSGVALQWASWCRSPDYLFNGKHLVDTQRYRELSMPILAYSFPDDRFAPNGAVEALLSKYPGCPITRYRIWPVDVRYPHIGHLGFFREHMHETLWQQTAEWLEGVG